jgi:hypothetical protein
LRRCCYDYRRRQVPVHALASQGPIERAVDRRPAGRPHPIPPEVAQCIGLLAWHGYLNLHQNLPAVSTTPVAFDHRSIDPAPHPCVLASSAPTDRPTRAREKLATAVWFVFGRPEPAAVPCRQRQRPRFTRCRCRRSGVCLSSSYVPRASAHLCDAERGDVRELSSGQGRACFCDRSSAPTRAVARPVRL